MAPIVSKFNIFNKLSKETILQLTDFFDERFLSTPPNKVEIQKIVGDDFDSKDIEKIISSFFNFIQSKLYPEKILNIIDNTKLEQDKKILLKEVIQKIHDKTNSENVKTALSSNFLHSFGFPRIYDVATVTEFKPISNTNKILKFIPSLIVSIKTQDLVNDIDDVFNFQIDLKQIKELTSILNKGEISLKTEIQEIRKKFGDEVID